MAQISDIDTGQEARCETPTFDPRCAFAWTLRSGELARRQRRREEGRPAPDERTSTLPVAARRVDGSGTDGSAARRFETPTFDPRSAFARTLRGGEIARVARKQRPPDASQLDLLVGAF